MNIDHVDCLRQSNNIGYQTVYNICDGTQRMVPWGSADWVVGGLLAMVFFVVALMFLTIIFAAVTESRR